jgi:hypothetical protein
MSDETNESTQAEEATHERAGPNPAKGNGPGPRIRRVASFLALVVVMTVVGTILKGIEHAATHHDGPTAQESAVLARAHAFEPLTLFRLYADALGSTGAAPDPLFHPTLAPNPYLASPAALASPTVAPSRIAVPIAPVADGSFLERLRHETISPKVLADLGKHPIRLERKVVPTLAPLPSGTAPADRLATERRMHELLEEQRALVPPGGDRRLATLEQITHDPAMLARPPAVDGVRLHHWGVGLGFLGFIVAFGDVVWGLVTSGPLGVRVFALGEILLGSAVTFWAIAAVPAFVAWFDGKRPEGPSGAVTLFFLWPLGTVAFASVMTLCAQAVLVVAAHAFGIVQNAVTETLADVTVFGLGAAFCASTVELRIHAVVESTIEAIVVGRE